MMRRHGNLLVQSSPARSSSRHQKPDADTQLLVDNTKLIAILFRQISRGLQSVDVYRFHDIDAIVIAFLKP